MAVLFWVLYLALGAFQLIMWIRLVFDFVVNFNRGWRPHGFGLLIAEVVFTVTDPPIKLVRRLVPPLRIGGFALDFAWTIVMLVAIILSYVCLSFIR